VRQPSVLTSQSEPRRTGTVVDFFFVDVDVPTVFVVQDALGLPELDVVLVVEGSDNVQGEGKRVVRDKSVLSDGESGCRIGELSSEVNLPPPSRSQLETGNTLVLSN
jgi:hypothetical protein